MRCLAIFPILLHVILNIANAQNCGTVQVCVQPMFAGQHRISLSMSLNSALPGSLDSVTISGYTYHLVSQAVNTMSAPGSSPNLNGASKTYTDFWDISIGIGDVQIGFPFVRGYDSSDTFCYGNFRHTFTVSSTGPSVCSSAPMLRSETVDFALVVDTTGSMHDDINAVKTEATNIVNELNSISTSFRGAVVEYNDRPGNDASIVKTLTSATPTMQNAIMGLTVAGGGDYAECLYDGLALTLALPWDSASRRVTVTMGDAPGKVCESGITLENVLALALFVDIVIDISPTVPARFESVGSTRTASKSVSLRLPVRNLTPLYMIAIGTNLSDFTTLAEETGGKVFSVSGATEVADAIKKAIRDGSGDPKVTKDLSVTLDCKASTKEYNVFTILNPNLFAVPFEFQNLFAEYKQNGSAGPGKTSIRTKTVSRIYITLKWTKTESGETGSVVYTPAQCP